MIHSTSKIIILNVLNPFESGGWLTPFSQFEMVSSFSLFLFSNKRHAEGERDSQPSFQVHSLYWQDSPVCCLNPKFLLLQCWVDVVGTTKRRGCPVTDGRSHSACCCSTASSFVILICIQLVSFYNKCKRLTYGVDIKNIINIYSFHGYVF